MGIEAKIEMNGVLVPVKPSVAMLMAGAMALKTQDARDALMSAELSSDPHSIGRTKMLIRWHAMLRQAELERQAEDGSCEASSGPTHFDELFDEGVEAGRLHERDRCAALAENPGFIEARDTEWDEGVNYAKKFIASAIRASDV